MAITTFKNLYDSFYCEEIMMVPTEESALDDLDIIVDCERALNYFFGFLNNEIEHLDNIRKECREPMEI